MKKTEKLAFILTLSNSVAVLLTGVLSLVLLNVLYFSGRENPEGPFVPERTAPLIPWFYVILALFLVSVVLSLVYRALFPLPGRKAFVRLKSEQFFSLRKKRDLSFLAPEEREEVEQARKKILARYGIGLLLSLLLLVFPVAYLVNPKHYDPSGNLFQGFLSLLAHTLPFYFLISLLWFFLLLAVDSTAGKVMPILFRLPEAERKKRREEKILRLVLRYSLLVLALTFLVVGAVRGEATDVMNKAVNICTECIGLG